MTEGGVISAVGLWSYAFPRHIVGESAAVYAVGPGIGGWVLDSHLGHPQLLCVAFDVIGGPSLLMSLWQRNGRCLSRNLHLETVVEVGTIE
jgi:hypothetical protein